MSNPLNFVLVYKLRRQKVVLKYLLVGCFIIVGLVIQDDRVNLGYGCNLNIGHYWLSIYQFGSK